MSQMLVRAVRLTADDLKALEVIRQMYGLETDSSALRFALRRVAKQVKRKQERNQDGKENPTAS